MFNQYNDPEVRCEIHYNSKCTGIFSVQCGDGLNEGNYTFIHALFDATIVNIDQTVRLAGQRSKRPDFNILFLLNAGEHES